MQGVRIIFLMLEPGALGYDCERQVGLGQKLPGTLDLIENNFLMNWPIQGLVETPLERTS
jgi:hypothetical protein